MKSSSSHESEFKFLFEHELCVSLTKHVILRLHSAFFLTGILYHHIHNIAHASQLLCFLYENNYNFSEVNCEGKGKL